MKWLILTLPENYEKAKTITSLIEDQGAECYLHTICNTRIEDLIDDCEETFLKKITKNLDTTTHCIFYNLGNFRFSTAIMYLVGFFTGLKIPVFITGKDEVLSTFLMQQNFVVIKDESKVMNVFTQYVQAYFVTWKKQNAIKKITDKGKKIDIDEFISVLEHDDLETAKDFLVAEIDINKMNKNGITALTHAVRTKNIKMVEWLLKRGADINCLSGDRGYTPVMDAVWISNLEITKLLLSKGAVLNTIGKDGQSILGIAVGAENEQISQVLFENGASPDVKDDMKMSARDYAKLFNKQRLLDLFESKQ